MQILKINLIIKNIYFKLKDFILKYNYYLNYLIFSINIIYK